MKNCELCQKKFKDNTQNKNKKFCSKSCKEIKTSRIKREKLEANKPRAFAEFR